VRTNGKEESEKESELFEKVILKMVQRHIEESSMLNAGQFDFHAHNSMMLQCMKLMDHGTLHFNHFKKEYKFQNTQNRTCIITKEMAAYSAMKSYMVKNNLHSFTFSPNTEKPIKAVICHLPPDKPAEVISNSLEKLSFSIINMRQMTNTRGTSPSIPCYLLTIFPVSSK
jgi:hypothetical protein